MKKLISAMLAFVLLISCAALSETVKGYSGTVSANGYTIETDAALLEDGAYLYMRDDNYTIYLDASLSGGVTYAYGDPEFHTLALDGAKLDYQTLAYTAMLLAGEGQGILENIMSYVPAADASYTAVKGGISESGYNELMLHISAADVLSAAKTAWGRLMNVLPAQLRSYANICTKYINEFTLSAVLDAYLTDMRGSLTLTCADVNTLLKISYAIDPEDYEHYTAKIDGVVCDTALTGSADIWMGSYNDMIDVTLSTENATASIRAQMSRTQCSFSVFSVDRYGYTQADVNGSITMLDNTLAFTLNSGKSTIAEFSLMKEADTLEAYVMWFPAQGVKLQIMGSSITGYADLFGQYVRWDLRTDDGLKGEITLNGQKVTLDLADAEFEKYEPENALLTDVSALLAGVLNGYR